MRSNWFGHFVRKPFQSGGKRSAQRKIAAAIWCTVEALEKRQLLSTGTWLSTPIPAPNGDDLAAMEQLTDGTIMVQEGPGSAAWDRYSPELGSYINGNWSNLASMNVQREYFVSNVLSNGNVLVVGGEDSNASGTFKQDFTNTDELFNPFANGGMGSWTNLQDVPTPNGQFGDDPTAVLPNGNILAGYISGPQTFIFNTATDKWSDGPTKLYNDPSDEENWITLPNGDILTYDLNTDFGEGEPQVFQAQVFVPSANDGAGMWEDASKLNPANPAKILTDSIGFELGPPTLLDNGDVFYTGANGSTGNTAIFDPTTMEWSAGPTMPDNSTASDQPGVLLPNGDYIFGAFDSTTSFVWQFDPNYKTDGQPAYVNIKPSNFSMPGGSHIYLLMLPTGQVALTNDENDHLDIYTPTGSPPAGTRPQVTDIFQNAGGGDTLIGTQLNGVSEGAQWGDDYEAFTNFPIVQIQNTPGGSQLDSFDNTSDWSSFGVGASSTPESVQVTLGQLSGGGDALVREIGSGVASPTVLYVNMTSLVNSITVQVDPSNSADLQMKFGSTVLDNVPFNDFSSVILAGAPSLNNFVIVNYNGGFFSQPVTFDGGQGSGADNSLIVVDDSSSGTRQWHVDSTRFVALDTGVSQNPTVNFNSVQAVTLESRAAGGEPLLAESTSYSGATVPSTTTVVITKNDVVSVTGVADPLIIDGGGGAGEQVTVGSLAPALGGTLAAVTSAVSVNGVSALIVDDSGDTTGHLSEISATAVTGFGFGSGGSVNYSAIGSLAVYGGKGASLDTISGTSVPTTLVPTALNTSSNMSVVDVLANSSPLIINGNGQLAELVSAINIGSGGLGLGGTLSQIAGPITITNTSNKVALTLDDSGDTNNTTGTIGATEITGFGMGAGGAVNYTGSQLASLTVHGGEGTNAETITNTSTPTTLFPSVLASGRLAAPPATVNVQATTSALTINGNDNVDDINIGSLAPTLGGGTLTQIAGAITVTNISTIESLPSTLTLDDSGDTTSRTGTISATSITGFGMGSKAAVNYTGSDFSSLIVNAGKGVNTETVTGTSTSTTLVAAAINTTKAQSVVNVQGAGSPLDIDCNDPLAELVSAINIGSAAPSLGGTLAHIAAPITVTNSSNKTALNLGDSGDMNNTTGTLAATAVTGFGMGVGGSVNYTGANLGSLTVRGGLGHNTETITGTSTPTTLYAGAGNVASDGVATVDVQATTSPLTINGNGLIDTINVGSLAPGLGSTLAPIAGSVTVTNTSNSSTLSVDDSADTNTTTGAISPTSITGFGLGQTSGTAAAINYSGGSLKSLTVRGGMGHNTETVTGTSTPTTLYAGAGNVASDGVATVNVKATTSPLTINGNGLVDTINVGSLAPTLGSTLASIAGSVTVTNTSNSSTLSVDDSGDTSNRTGTISGTTITGFGMGKTSGTAAAINYSGGSLKSLTVRGGLGHNTETITGTSTPTTLYAGAGNVASDGVATVNVQATTSTLTINGNGLVDTVNVGSLAPSLGGTLAPIAGSVTVTNTSNSSALSLDDSGDTNTTTGTLSDSAITGLGLADGVTVAYNSADLKSLTLRARKGSTIAETLPVPSYTTLVGITVNT